MTNKIADALIQKILANGNVTADEVRSLEKSVESDWVIDKSEVELLFRANKAIGEKDEDCPEWTAFFVKTVTRLVVLDLFTPGEIDQEEGDWLADLIDSHSTGNFSENQLMSEIRNTTSSISGRLGERMKSFE